MEAEIHDPASRLGRWANKGKVRKDHKLPRH